MLYEEFLVSGSLPQEYIVNMLPAVKNDFSTETGN